MENSATDQNPVDDVICWMFALACCLVALGAAGCGTSPAANAAPPPQDVDHRVTLSAAAFQPRGATFFGTSWQLGNGGEIYAPLAIDVGCTITDWSMTVQKGVATSQLTAGLQYTEPASSTALLVGPELYGFGKVGALTFASSGLTHVVLAGADYSIRVARDYTASSDFVMAGDLMFTCPGQ